MPRIRGVRWHLWINPAMAPQAADQLKQIPGVEIEESPGWSHIQVPASAYQPAHTFLSHYFAANRHSIREQWGWRSYRNREFPQKILPQMDPREVPGLKEETRAALLPHQIAACRRLIEHGGGLEEISTGGGKSLVALVMAAIARAADHKVLIVCEPGKELQWKAQILRWLTPEAVAGITILFGENGCEVRAYKEQSRVVLRALVDETEAKARWRTLKGRWATSLDPLWGDHGEKLPGVTIRQSDVSKSVMEKAISLGIVTNETQIVRPARWTVWDTDTNLPVKDFDHTAPVQTIVDGQVAIVPPGEAAALYASQLNSELRTNAKVVLCGSAVLANRRRALRKWQPDMVIIDESHGFKSWDRWKRIPATMPGAKPTFVLAPSQAASAFHLCENASTVVELTASAMPDRRRDLWAQYDYLDPRGMGNFKAFTARYCNGRNVELHNGQMIWNSTGEDREGRPLPLPQPIIEEFKWRSALLHHITPKSESHVGVPPINRVVHWLGRGDTNKPGHGDWSLPVRAMQDKVNRLLDIAAESKRKYVVNHYVPYLLEKGWRGVVLTGSHESCERLGAEFIKRVGTKTWSTRDATGARVEAPPLVVVAHGGSHSTEERKEILEKVIGSRLWGNHERTPGEGPAVLVGTIDCWGQGWDGMHFLDFAGICRLPWNHGKGLQVEGRWERLGGLWSILVEYFLMKNSIDERILSRVTGKAAEVLLTFDKEDLDAFHKGISEEEDQDDILRSMLSGLLEDGEARALNEDGEDFADEYDVSALVERTIERGTDIEQF